MNRWYSGLSLALVTLVVAGGTAPTLSAQTWATNDPVLERIWEEAMENSHLEELGQQLLDSIGPRLTGSPSIDRAHDWAARTLQGWGVDADNQQYGTWRGWDRGITHIDLIEPRLRTLEGTMLAWSPGTDGPVEGEVVVFPAWETEEELEQWMATEVEGRFVAIAFPQPTCRPDYHYEDFGSQGALDRLNESRQAALQEFRETRVAQPGLVRLDLDAAGALGILESNWIGRPGTNRLFSTNTENAVTLDLSCEDYGLVYRLAESGRSPVLRVNAQAEDLGEVPVYNTIGVIEGSELPNEYVFLSAHFDSWDGGSGATDNGTGSILMMETMRILSEVYPNPRRSIMIGLWGGEEQGLNGSRRFVADNPEIVDNIQALFNQDNGTGRVANISTQGLIEAGEHWARWLSLIPQQITTHINLNLPGIPSTGGTDHASFICAGAPAFGLSSISWGYNPYTWHTMRDTYDKIVFEEVRNNAALIAMLTYLASEDPAPVSRVQRTLPGDREWPTCQPGRTSSN
ncbi:MAG: M28 family peptidase [Gemmatimonadales bacterium]|nr:MAG: M28 family peptidase [Gemmatimonadales bacterium]